MEEIIQTNCSEVVWRLSDKIHSTDTSGWPNSCLELMIAALKKNKKAQLKNVSDNGSGGDEDYVYYCYDIAKAIINKKITKKQGEELEKTLWDNGTDNFKESLKNIIKQNKDETK